MWVRGTERRQRGDKIATGVAQSPYTETERRLKRDGEATVVYLLRFLAVTI